MAALSAAVRNRARAVVLVATSSPEDKSDLSPANVRAYLRLLRVPLFVWCVDGDRAALEKTWGAAADASNFYDFDTQVQRLAKTLDRQRIVWVEGVHLPNEIDLDDRVVAGRAVLGR